MSGELIWALVRLLIALPLILGMAYLVLKYGLARRYMLPTGNRRMKLVEQLPLGPKTTLSLVALGGKLYFFAHQDNGISLVKELDNLEEPEESIIGDVVELTPRTIEEFDRLQKPVSSGITGAFKDKGWSRLNQLAGWPVMVKNMLLAKLAVKKCSREKGEKS